MKLQKSMQDLIKAIKTGFCSDIKQTNIHSKMSSVYNPKVRMLEHFSCKQTVQQHRNNVVTFKANFANKYLNLVLYSFAFSKYYPERLLLDVFKC